MILCVAYEQPVLSPLQPAAKFVTSNSVTSRCVSGLAEANDRDAKDRMAENFIVTIVELGNNKIVRLTVVTSSELLCLRGLYN